jgi:hypothetical protein
VKGTYPNHEAGANRSGFRVFVATSSNRYPDDPRTTQTDLQRVYGTLTCVYSGPTILSLHGGVPISFRAADYQTRGRKKYGSCISYPRTDARALPGC